MSDHMSRLAEPYAVAGTGLMDANVDDLKGWKLDRVNEIKAGGRLNDYFDQLSKFNFSPESSAGICILYRTDTDKCTYHQCVPSLYLFSGGGIEKLAKWHTAFGRDSSASHTPGEEIANKNADSESEAMVSTLKRFCKASRQGSVFVCAPKAPPSTSLTQPEGSASTPSESPTKVRKIQPWDSVKKHFGIRSSGKASETNAQEHSKAGKMITVDKLPQTELDCYLFRISDEAGTWRSHQSKAWELVEIISGGASEAQNDTNVTATVKSE